MLEVLAIFGALVPSLADIARFLERDPSVGLARYLIVLIARLFILFALIAGVIVASGWIGSIVTGAFGTVLAYVGLVAVGLWLLTITVRYLAPSPSDHGTSNT